MQNNKFFRGLLAGGMILLPLVAFADDNMTAGSAMKATSAPAVAGKPTSKDAQPGSGSDIDPSKGGKTGPASEDGSRK